MCSLARFDLTNQSVCKPIQPHTYARVLAFAKISAAWFCSCKLLWRSDECVLLPCFNMQPDILQFWTVV